MGKLFPAALLSVCLATFPSLWIVAGETGKTGESKILQIMQTQVIPSSDAIWQVQEPAKAEDWTKLEKHTIQLVKSGAELGMSEVADLANSSQSLEQWKLFSADMVGAAELILQAAKNRDLDAFYDAGDVLYSSCVSCHQVFHPDINK